VTQNNESFVPVHEIVRALINDPVLQFKDRGSYLQEGVCPSCGKKELYVSKEKPWIIDCNRKNRCGANFKVSELVPELFTNFTERYKPTEKEPNRTADAYLALTRGFDLSKIRGWYEQAACQMPRTNFYFTTVRFYLDKERTRYWERIIDKTEKAGKKAHFGGRRKPDGSVFKGDVWTPPGQTLKKGDTCFIVEGIFHAIALYHHGIKVAAAFSCNNFPSNFIKQHEKKEIMWVLGLDGDKAGVKDMRKHAKRLKDMGQKYMAYKLPAGRDWDDLHKEGMLPPEGEWGRPDPLVEPTQAQRFVKECRYQGRLMLAENVREYAYHVHFQTGKKRIVVGMFGRLYSCEVDIEKFQKEKMSDRVTDKRNISVFRDCCSKKRICNRHPECMYLERDEIQGEQWYVFKIRSPKRPTQIVNLDGTSIISVEGFRKALVTKTSGGDFHGSPQDLKELSERWLGDEIKEVRSVSWVGYDKESESYVFPERAYHKGQEKKLSEENFFSIGREYIRPGLKSISVSPKGDFTPDWFDDFLTAFSWQGVALLSFWLGTLFVQQIRQQHKSFPFFELTGDPGAGKSTVLEFLWKLFGRDDYEGFDVMKATKAGRRRAFSQLSNLPIVIIESDRDSGITDGKQRQFNFDECKPFYNGRGTGTLGVAKRNNEVEESIFQASLVISQNAEVEGSEALLQRIVHCHADKAHHGHGTREVARKFERASSSDYCGFLAKALKNEKKILSTYFEAFDRIEGHFSQVLKNERIAKNHAQIAACGHALKVIFPSISDQQIQSLQNYLRQRAALREDRLAMDHPAVEDFWETYEYLEAKTHSSEYGVNHTLEKGQIALSFKTFEERCRALGQTIPDMKLLKKLLPHSKRYPLIEKSRVVKSCIISKSIRCWVFQDLRKK